MRYLRNSLPFCQRLTSYYAVTVSFEKMNYGLETKLFPEEICLLVREYVGGMLLHEKLMVEFDNHYVQQAEIMVLYEREFTIDGFSPDKFMEMFVNEN